MAQPEGGRVVVPPPFGELDIRGGEAITVAWSRGLKRWSSYRNEKHKKSKILIGENVQESLFSKKVQLQSLNSLHHLNLCKIRSKMRYFSSF